MHDASFQVFTQFIRHLSLLVTHTISQGQEALITLYPKGTARGMSFLLDSEYWFRCLWDGPFLSGWKVRYAKNMPAEDTQVLAQARAAAVTQTVYLGL